MAGIRQRIVESVVCTVLYARGIHSACLKSVELLRVNWLVQVSGYYLL